jgi:hypothetical protein
MSEPSSKYERFGFDQDPFDTRIADEDIAARYKLVGRDEQEHQLREFVEDGIRSPNPMKKRLIFGEYGTGKSHHLINLRDGIESGVEVEQTEYDAIAIYLGNLGLSIKRLYEKILEELVDFDSQMEEVVDTLDDVEPEKSVDEAYQFERLQDNITENLRRIANAAREDYGYRCLFLFIDEAEDIANEDENKVQPFIRAFIHLVNNLNAAGIHILLGFSQGARMRITSYEDDEDTLGNALIQRFQGGEIYLGDLTTTDVKDMLIDRMDQHRTTNVGDITPIVEETVEVVTEVTGGHPREILALYSEALSYAEELDKERIDGDAVLHALTGFDSFTRDEELLGQQELTNLRKGLEDAHPDARDDFDRLQGRLIGEAEEVPEDAFTDGVPGTLLSPIEVEGSDQDLRVLEQREQHGKYYYIISEAATDFLFESGGEGGTRIQKLDLQASSAPEKYQKEMSRGLGIALQDDGHGSLHKSPVTKRRDRYEFALYLISIKREAGKNNQNVALGVYNGQEIPEELVELYVAAINDDDAAFGVLVKENQQLSAEANGYLNELDEVTRNYFEDRVIEVNLTTEQRDEFIYGRLLALGDTDSDADEDVDTGHLVNQLDITSKLKNTFDETILPYPEESYRDLIEHLRGESTRDFTIGGLRDALELEQYELKGDIMDGLRSQSLVAKSGQRWKYPDLESDKPPWHELYRHLNDDGPLTIDELQERIVKEYVLDCPPGDENAMFQWYLDHLQMQDYVEATEMDLNGETVDAYQVVSVTDQFNEARRTAEERLLSAEELLDEATNIDVEGLHSYDTHHCDLETRLDDFEEIFDPDHSDLDEVKALIGDITELEEEIEDAISERREVILGEAEDLATITISDLRTRIEEQGEEGSFTQRLNELDGELKQYQEELNELIENEQYKRLNSRTDAIEQEVGSVAEDIEEILETKGRCAELFEQVRATKQSAESALEDISTRNPEREKLNKNLDTLESLFNDYRSYYNNDEYEQALELLQSEAKSLADDLEERASSTAEEQASFESRLDDFEQEIESIQDADRRQKAEEIIESAKLNLEEGNFADLPAQLNDLKDLLEGPTREELFERALKDHDGSIAKITANEDFDTSEAFRLLDRFYSSPGSSVSIEDVQAVISDE